MNHFDRTDVLRILRITARQLSGWQRAGLVAGGESFSFFDLIQLKKVRDLRAKRVKSTTIRASLLAMQRQVAGMENPLIEASALPLGSRVAFRSQGTLFDPIDGQLLMQFDQGGQLVETPLAKAIHVAETAAELFAHGVSLEEDPASADEAILAYQKVLAIDPEYAPAHINLGTLFYNKSKYALAEQHYRKAIESDPRYSLAYFDLGNVLDETNRLEEAIAAYKAAIQLAPTYSDAHYNIALAYERTRQPRLAMKHWKAYLKLDTHGPWAVYARTQYRKLLENEKLKIVYRR